MKFNPANPPTSPPINNNLPTPNRTYSGPDKPTVYDSNWQLYTNLKPVTVAAFQDMQEWKDFLSYVALSPKTATVATPTAVVSGVLAISPPAASPAALNIAQIQPSVK